MAVVLPLLFLFLSLLPPTLASFIVDPVTAKAATCEPVLLQWQGGKAPWTLSIVAPDGSTFESPGTFKTTSFHWTVDLAAGTVVAARLTDATGATATSNSFTIQDGTTGCNQFVAVPPPPGTTASVPADTQSATTTTSTGSVPSETQTSAVPSEPSASAARSVAGTSSASTASQSSAKPTAAGPPATTSTSSTSSTLQGPYPESSPSAAPAYQMTRRKTNVGTVFAILIPCLILLVILGLCFMRWRRRRRSPEPPQPLGPFALEAQPVPSRWFTAEKYRRTFGGRSAELNAPQAEQVQGPSASAAQASTPQWFNRLKYRRASGRRSPALGEPHGAETQRPTLNIATNTAAAPLAAPQSAFTPGTGAAFTPGAVYTYTSADSKSPVAIPASESTVASAAVQTLQAQIHALMQENAVLANLASPPAESPPPAYV